MPGQVIQEPCRQRPDLRARDGCRSLGRRVPCWQGLTHIFSNLETSTSRSLIKMVKAKPVHGAFPGVVTGLIVVRGRPVVSGPGPDTGRRSDGSPALLTAPLQPGVDVAPAGCRQGPMSAPEAFARPACRRTARACAYERICLLPPGCE